MSSRVVCRASRACCAFYKRRRSGCELTRRREITFERILHINTKRVQDRAPKNYRSHTRMTFHQKSRHQPCFFSKLRLQPFDLVHKPLLQPLRSQIGADDVHAERNHRGGVSGSLGMAVWAERLEACDGFAPLVGSGATGRPRPGRWRRRAMQKPLSVARTMWERLRAGGQILIGAPAIISPLAEYGPACEA